MDAIQVRNKIKRIISDASDIDVNDIGDDSSWDDLCLDSLTLLEISVDVDYEFKLGVPEETLQQIRTVKEGVELIVRRLEERQKL